LLGSAFGALAKNPAAADLAESTARTSKSLMQDIEKQADQGRGEHRRCTGVPAHGRPH
jgi:hypothetical protein